MRKRIHGGDLGAQMPLVDQAAQLDQLSAAGETGWTRGVPPQWQSEWDPAVTVDRA